LAFDFCRFNVKDENTTSQAGFSAAKHLPSSLMPSAMMITMMITYTEAILKAIEGAFIALSLGTELHFKNQV
jgi:hypothetical protein